MSPRHLHLTENMAEARFSTSDLKDVLDFSINLAREAGEVILEGSDAILKTKSEDIGEKKNSVDLVTEYDKGVENLVRNKIKDAYPDYDL